MKFCSPFGAISLTKDCTAMRKRMKSDVAVRYYIFVRIEKSVPAWRGSRHPPSFIHFSKLIKDNHVKKCLRTANKVCMLCTYSEEGRSELHSKR